MICLPQSHQISDLRMKLHWEDFILNSPTSWICSVDISTLDFRFLSTHSTSHQICQRIFKAKLELKLQLKKKKKKAAQLAQTTCKAFSAHIEYQQKSKICQKALWLCPEPQPPGHTQPAQGDCASSFTRKMLCSNVYLLQPLRFIKAKKLR